METQNRRGMYGVFVDDESNGGFFVRHSESLVDAIELARNLKLGGMRACFIYDLLNFKVVSPAAR
jgi:hypothetical protein